MIFKRLCRNSVAANYKNQLVYQMGKNEQQAILVFLKI
jgi:hypothetical protein